MSFLPMAGLSQDRGCYSEQTNHSRRAFIGQFKNKPLYCEIWTVEGILHTTTNFVILRTDTFFVDSLDFCLSPPSEIYFSDTTITIEKFPTLFQPLIYGDYGYSNYSPSDINLISQDMLLVTYWIRPNNLDDNIQMQQTYKFDGKYFKLLFEKEIDRIKNEVDNEEK